MIHLWLEVSDSCLSNEQENVKMGTEDPYYSINLKYLTYAENFNNSRIHILFKQMKHCPEQIIW